MTRDELIELLEIAIFNGTDAPGAVARRVARAQLATLETAGLAIVPAALLVGDGRTHNVCPKCRELTEQPLAAGRVDK